MTPRRRTTGPSPKTRLELWGRARDRCELCEVLLAGVRDVSVHHRCPRRMGGTRKPWINDLVNLLLVCGSGTTGCHGRIESNRSIAYDAGWLLHDGADPWETPVDLAIGRVHLTSDGAMIPVSEFA